LRHEKECRLERNCRFRQPTRFDSPTGKTRQNAGIPLEKEI